KEHARATADADQLAQATDASADTLSSLARIYARSAAAAGANRPESERHAARSVELLQQALGKGYKDLKQLKESTDLAFLHTRADYKRLLAEAETKLVSAAADLAREQSSRAETLHNLGRRQWERNQWDAALKSFEEARLLREKLVTAYPDV